MTQNHGSTTTDGWNTDGAAVADLQMELIAREGYTPHHNDIDERAAEETQCPVCGDGWCRYVGLSRPGSYRALAICRRCGAWTEF